VAPLLIKSDKVMSQVVEPQILDFRRFTRPPKCRRDRLCVTRSSLLVTKDIRTQDENREYLPRNSTKRNLRHRMPFLNQPGQGRTNLSKLQAEYDRVKRVSKLVQKESAKRRGSAGCPSSQKSAGRMPVKTLWNAIENYCQRNALWEPTSPKFFP